MNNDPLIIPPKENDPLACPNVKTLIAEFQRCSPWAGSSWNRVRVNEDIRYNRWAGQTPDGKKHDSQGKEAFPWDGASDQRVLLADDIITGNAAEMWEAFWRSMSAQKLSTQEENSYALKLLEYYTNDLLIGHLYAQVELSAQYRETYGWVALHPTWEREVTLEYQTVEMETLVEVAQKIAQQEGEGIAGAMNQKSRLELGMEPNPLAVLPELIVDPSREDEAVEAVKSVYGDYAAMQVKHLTQVAVPPMKDKLARQVVRSLRENGEAKVPIPVVKKNQPAVYALKPWEEFFLPAYTTDAEKSRFQFHRVWMTEVDVMSKVLTEGWDPKWVEEARKQKGKASSWNTGAPTQAPVDLAAAMTAPDSPNWSVLETKTDLIEVVYAVYRELDENNVPGMYCTVFNPMVCMDEKNNELCAAHYLVEHTRGKYPYVVGRREMVQPNVTSSRGVPELVNTYQRALKVQIDGATDWTSIGVLPPVNVYTNAVGTKYRFGPAVQNTVQPGREPKFMNVPNMGVPVAFELIKTIELWCDRYFGRANALVPQSESGSRKQKSVGSFLLMWSEAMCRVLELSQFYMPDEEFSKVTGAPEGWLEKRRQAPGLLTGWLHFDVRELDPEFVAKQLTAINQTVIPGEAAGQINRAALTRYQMRSINPIAARALMVDAKQASEQLLNGVKEDIAMMFLGNEPKYVEMDPTASTKLQYARQVLQANPNYIMAIRRDPKGRFAELLQKWSTNLMFSMTQEENKKVGAIGVKPETPQQ